MTDYNVYCVSGEDLLADAHAVRRAVLVDEQGIPADIAVDGKDQEATLFVACDPDKDITVGTVRLRTIDTETAMAERLAVRSAYRSEGIGRQLMARLEEQARKRSYMSIVVHALTPIVPFYQKLGYETVSDEQEGSGIHFVEMVKTLDRR